MTAPRRYDPSPDRARAIREARDCAHMSERDLARTLGVSRTTVRVWEAAARDPGPDMAARIAVATRMPVSSLLMPAAPARRDRPAPSCERRPAEWPTPRRFAA